MLRLYASMNVAAHHDVLLNLAMAFHSSEPKRVQSYCKGSCETEVKRCAGTVAKHQTVQFSSRIWDHFLRKNPAFAVTKHAILVEHNGMDSRKHETNFRSAGNY